MKKTGYRPCVGVMLVNAEGKVFVGRRIDNREGNWWQMPQGGVDKGEDLRAAALRELAEEMSLEAFAGVSDDQLEAMRAALARVRENIAASDQLRQVTA